LHFWLLWVTEFKRAETEWEMEGSLILFCYEVNCIMKQWKPEL